MVAEVTDIHDPYDDDSSDEEDIMAEDDLYEDDEVDEVEEDSEIEDCGLPRSTTGRRARLEWDNNI